MSESSEVFTKLYQKALALLARREHSEQELRRKLGAAPDEVIERVLDQLIAERYLSDQRYAEMIVRNAYQKGQGPMRVRQTLSQNGVASEMASSALSDFDGDWYQAAFAARRKRFSQLPDDIREKAKQQRFLAGRGFDRDQIEAAFQVDEFDYE